MLNSMNIRTTQFGQLTRDEVATWSVIQRSEPTLASPFFRPEFTAAVAAVRDDVEVAVLEEGGRTIGFFPYHRSRRNTAGPIGGILSDFHGIIAPAGISLDPIELVRACRLKAWHFDHLICQQRRFAPFAWQLADSPYVDLSAGFEAYLRGRKNRHGFESFFGKKSRMLARDVGPWRYEENVADRTMITTLVKWKSDQYRRTRVPNIFGFDWVHDLFDRILDCRGEDFCPHLSIAYAGDTVAAIHFGLRSGAVLQHWFPVYNVELARYSPGFLHSLELFKSVAADGIRRIDLGKGREEYKRRIMSAADQVAVGRVDLRPASAMVRRAWWRTRERVRESRIAAPIRLPFRLARLAQHWVGCAITNLEKRA
jgi:CelD/BcsL family acetyltransferase involved in cellulose biosynthesis